MSARKGWGPGRSLRRHPGLPEVAVLLATCTGWSLRAYPPGANEGCDAAGQKIDFAATKAERLANGDLRLSIEERYPDHQAYVSAVVRAALQLRLEHLLLDEDLWADYLAAAPSSGRQ